MIQVNSVKKREGTVFRGEDKINEQVFWPILIVIGTVVTSFRGHVVLFRSNLASAFPWRNYSPRKRRSRVCTHGRGLCQGVADGCESAPAVAAAGFDN
jgi:hypothetical protein